MARESTLELKVGSFIMMALLALSFFVISVSDFSFLEKGRHVQVVFGFANGLREAAPVRLAGVDVGLVKKLKVFENQADHSIKVRARLWIKEGIDIPVDSTVTINQLGLLGEKYVEIIPGTSGNMVQEGGTLNGRNPVPIEKITDEVSVLTGKFEMTLDNINNDILTNKNKQSLENALAGFAAVATDLRQGRGTMGLLLKDDSIYRNLDELTEDLKLNPWKLLYRPKPGDQNK